MSNIEKVQAIYAAFGTGNIPAILEHLAPDVDWEYVGTPEIPWLMRRQGRDGAAAFFRVANDLLDFKSFEVTRFFESGNIVIALATLECVVKPTGKTIREIDEPHLWHFDEKGRVAKLRHAANTFHQWSAYKG